MNDRQQEWDKMKKRIIKFLESEVREYYDEYLDSEYMENPTATMALQILQYYGEGLDEKEFQSFMKALRVRYRRG